MTGSDPPDESFWRVDLHMHTSHSPDCLSRPDAVVSRARSVGLDRIAITDHDEISGAFAAAEWSERVFGHRAPRLAHGVRGLHGRHRLAGAGALVVLALAVMGMGHPSPEVRWARMAPAKQPLLDRREVMMHPGEFVSVAANRQLELHVVDVRSEADYNRFHLVDAVRVPLDELARGSRTREFLELPPNAVIVMVSNDEAAAARGWQYLVAEGIPNVYLLEGGVNGWLDRFAPDGGVRGAGPRPRRVRGRRRRRARGSGGASTRPWGAAGPSPTRTTSRTVPSSTIRC